jgi:hypothetical protein
LAKSSSQSDTKFTDAPATDADERLCMFGAAVMLRKKMARSKFKGKEFAPPKYPSQIIMDNQETHELHEK